MSNKNNIEELLKKIAKENQKDMQNIDDIDESALDRIELLAYAQYTSKKNNKALKTVIQVSAAAIAVFLLFTAALFITDAPAIRAFNKDESILKHLKSNYEGYKESSQTISHTKEFAVLDNMLSYRHARPMWLPEGFELDDIQIEEFSNKTFKIIYYYEDIRDSEKYLHFYIETINIDQLDMSLENFEKILINDIDVYFDINGESKAIYLDDNGFYTSVKSTIEKDILIKVIESME